MAGMKHDSGKPRLTLVPPFFVEGMARVLEMGERRYGRANWKEGLAYSRILDAARRHLAAIEQGEDIDPDSGKQHAFHVACNMLFLSYFTKNGGGDLDDRDTETTVPRLRGMEDDPVVPPQPASEERLDLQPVQESQPQPGEGEGQNEEAADPIRALQHRITTWADQVFPSRTPEGALHKMMVHELPELLNGGLDDPLEYADVLILLLDIASLRGIDAISAAHEKMSINERRQWAVDPRTGLMSHTKEAEGLRLQAEENAK